MVQIMVEILTLAFCHGRDVADVCLILSLKLWNFLVHQYIQTFDQKLFIEGRLALLIIQKMRIFPGKRSNAMSLEKNQKEDKIKTWRREEEEQAIQPVPQFHSLHNLQSLPPNIKGVNTYIETYAVSLSGATNANLWSLNLSTRPGEQKRFLSILGASLSLVNYGIDSFPSRLNLMANQVTASFDDQGNPSHCICLLAAKSPAVPVDNPGMTGYNVTYTILAEIPPIEITNIPQLTFDLTIDNSNTPTTYPLSAPLVALIQITHVMI